MYNVFIIATQDNLTVKIERFILMKSIDGRSSLNLLFRGRPPTAPPTPEPRPPPSPTGSSPPPPPGDESAPVAVVVLVEEEVDGVGEAGGERSRSARTLTEVKPLYWSIWRERLREKVRLTTELYGGIVGLEGS